MNAGTQPICFVGRKARRTTTGSPFEYNEPDVEWPDAPNTTAAEAKRRLQRRSGVGEAELIGYSSDSGACLVAWVADHRLFT